MAADNMLNTIKGRKLVECIPQWRQRGTYLNFFDAWFACLVRLSFIFTFCEREYADDLDTLIGEICSLHACSMERWNC